jgi:peptidoglycan/xylan/chitin deacetylase (PgdA/CDA1 family)
VAIVADGLAGATTHGDGAVVLLHTWPGGTGDAVGPLIEGLAAAGATFVRLDALETLP